MDIQGKVIQLLPLQTGEGKNGTWRKQEFVIETESQYPKKVCISAWGDKISEDLLQVGNNVVVSFDLESREYNGRWYTDVKAWKIDTANASSDASQMSAPVAATPKSTTAPTPLPTELQVSDDGSDVLPF